MRTSKRSSFYHEGAGSPRIGKGAGGEPAFFVLRNAVVQRAGKPLLSIDSFSLARGEHVALLGPNGAGKSTFVLCC